MRAVKNDLKLLFKGMQIMLLGDTQTGTMLKMKKMRKEKALITVNYLGRKLFYQGSNGCCQVGDHSKVAKVEELQKFKESGTDEEVFYERLMGL